VFDVGLEQGSNNSSGSGCHGQKRTMLQQLFGDLPNRMLVAGQLPAYAQFTVLRLGSRLIGTLPAEATTTAGREMRSRMLAAASARGLPVTAALILGLTNGYMEYITTPEEYTAQYYEGGSMLYGPGEAAMVSRTLVRLVTQLSGGDSLPSARVPPLRLEVGTRRKIVPRRRSGPEPVPAFLKAWCSGDTLYARLRLGSVGDWAVPTGDVSPQPRVAIVGDGADRPVLSWDDDPLFELRLEDGRHGIATWELRWSGAVRGRYRVRVGDRESDAIACQGGRLSDN
jgi:hypothetical protein